MRIDAIHLYREGDRVHVAIEVDGRWTRVINESLDANFSHIVEASGMESAASAPAEEK